MKANIHSSKLIFYAFLKGGIANLSRRGISLTSSHKTL
jgi:hypothetical protein